MTTAVPCEVWSYVLATATRNCAFYREVRSFLSAGLFMPQELHFRLYWQTIGQLHDQHVEITPSTLVAALAQRMSEQGIVLNELQRSQLYDDGGVLWAAFALPREELQVEYAASLVKDIVVKRGALQRISRLTMDNLSADELREELQRVADMAQRASVIGNVPTVQTAPDLADLQAPALRYHQSGAWFIDGVLGGIAEKDIIGLLGATGSGKTTFSIYAAVQIARSEYARARQEGRPPRWVGFFTYEESADLVRPRIWANAFQIPRDKLMTLQDGAVLTTPDNPDDYERRLFAGMPSLLGERRRWELNAGWLNQTFKLFDMSGSPDHPNAGGGGVEEIAAVIDRVVQQTGVPPIAVVVDWVGAACSNMLSGPAAQEDRRLRLLISNFPNQVRRHITNIYNCAAILSHQLRGEDAKKHPAVLMHHSQSAESKAFANFLVSCLCLGNMDQSTGCIRLNWSKVRHRPTRDMLPLIARINDMFGSIDDVSTEYVVDEMSRSFIPRSELRQVTSDIGTSLRSFG